MSTFVANPNCCDRCSELDGTNTSKEDVEEVAHPNCKCHLENEESDDMKKTFSKKNLKETAMNDTLDEEFYTGFTYTNPQNTEDVVVVEGVETPPTTYDFGSTLVQVSPLGNFVGSDSEGKPVDETITIDSLKRILQNITGEILVDVDHASDKGDSTKAAAWATDFRVVDFLAGNSNGLYARLKWTKYGRELVENREYRYLSPVWTLDDSNEPIQLLTIALTNKPALKGISPIINSEPNKEPNKSDKDQESDSEKMNKDSHNEQTKYLDNKMDKEILELVGVSPVDPEKGVSDEEKAGVLDKIKSWKDYFVKAETEKKEAEMKDSFNQCMSGYEVSDEAKNDLYEVWKSDPEKFEKIVNACGTKKPKNEEPKDEVKEEDKAEEVKEEIVEGKAEGKSDEEIKKEIDEEMKDDEKEVIEKEALNSKPVEMPKTPKDIADTLHGEAFLKYVKEHKDELR